VILELLHNGNIICNMNKIVLIDKKDTGDDILDDAINILDRIDKIKNIKYWIEKLPGRLKKLKRRIQDKLVAEGIVKKEKHKFLFIRYTRYPEQNPLPEQNIRDEIQHILFYEQTPDERLLSLISLMYACELVNVIVPKEKRKPAKKRIKELVKNEPFGKAVSKIVNEHKAALAVSTTSVTSIAIIT